MSSSKNLSRFASVDLKRVAGQRQTRIGGQQTIAVVGGGSVAVSFVYQLVLAVAKRRMPLPPAILIIEPQEQIGPGHAYEDDFPSNLLNTRADTMSPVFGESAHFLNWLKRTEAEWRPDFPNVRLSGDEFLPRPLFGKYLNAVYEEALALAGVHRISITHIRDSVTDFLPVGNRVCLDTCSGQGHLADVVVLALGNMPSVAFQELVGTDGFFNSPYPTKRLASAVPRDSTVAVIGTNLSAIDAVIGLSHAGHRGKIVCVSRNGRLPSVRGVNNNKHRLQYLTREALAALRSADGGVTLDDIVTLMVREFQAVEGRPPNLANILKEETCTYEYLSTEIQESSSASRTWQSVVYATNSIIEHVWNSLNCTEKRRFFERFRSKWFSYRVSFPLNNAAKIRELMRCDRMSVMAGFQKVVHDRQSGRFQISLYDPRSRLESQLWTSAVVNASSYSTDVTTSRLPLVQNLLRRGIAVSDEFGGFVQDFETGRVKNRDGVPSQRLYALGSLATGTYFWTNAMDVNTRIASVQAEVIAATLAQTAVTDDGVAPKSAAVADSAVGASGLLSA